MLSSGSFFSLEIPECVLSDPLHFSMAVGFSMKALQKSGFNHLAISSYYLVHGCAGEPHEEIDPASDLGSTLGAL